MSLSIVAIALATTLVSVQTSRLDAIVERGYINVGTTGDYRPFSYLRADGAFEGMDIDAANALGQALGVEVRFVKTSWSALVAGIHEGRYDVAMSGISRTLERQRVVGLSDPYFALGKCPLIRRVDRERFPNLAAIDRPGIKIGVNPGGTNETFVREHIKNAAIIVIENNLAIPGAVAAGDVDVMLTDNVEAVLVSRENDALYAVSPDAPLTHDELSYMLPRDDAALRDWLDLWVHRMKLTGELDRLREKWLGASPPRDGVDFGLRHRRQQRFAVFVAMPALIVNAIPQADEPTGTTGRFDTSDRTLPVVAGLVQRDQLDIEEWTPAIAIRHALTGEVARFLR